MFECKYCGKVCKNTNSQRQHEIRCSHNPDRKDYDRVAKYSLSRKGKTKYDDPVIMRSSESLRESYRSGKLTSYWAGKPGTMLNKHHSEESKLKISRSVSATRARRFAEGSLFPPVGSGRGKYSYIVYHDKKYMLRSTYEFVYALYLIYKGIDFEVESVRVPAIRPNQWAKTLMSDFCIDNKLIVEVKGIPSGKDALIRDSFLAAGYEFKELFSRDISDCKRYLRSIGVDIDNLLNLVIEGHNSRNYYVHYIT